MDSHFYAYLGLSGESSLVGQDCATAAEASAAPAYAGALALELKLLLL